MKPLNESENALMNERLEVAMSFNAKEIEIEARRQKIEIRNPS